MDTQDWRASAKHFDFQGHQIAFWTGGNESARPLLLVHGFPTCAWDWVPVWETLGANHRLIACDMLGFGLSDKPKSGYSIHLQSDVQEELLAHLGIGDFDALVHDYGVSVGQELLARQQDGSGAHGLGKMVFLNGGIFPDQHRPVLMQKIGVSPFGFLVGLLMKRKNFGASFSQVFGPDTKPREAELDEFWEQQWKATVIRCQRSANPPLAHQRRTADTLGADWREMDAGHYPMLTHPQESAALIAG